MLRSAEIITMGEPGSLSCGAGLIARRAKGAELDYFAYVPKSATPATPLMVSIHGVERRALQHAVRFARLAEEFGFVVLAPLFSKLRTPRYQRLERGPSGDCPMAALELTTDMFQRETGIDAAPLRLFGYSGGAQFAMRYAMLGAMPVSRLALAAPGWFTMPDPAQPFPLGLAASANTDDRTPDITKLLATPVLLTVGADDTRRDGSLNRSPLVDAQQGLTRVERAQRWKAAMSAVAKKRDVAERVELRMLTGAGHDFDDNMRSHGLGEIVAHWLMR